MTDSNNPPTVAVKQVLLYGPIGGGNLACEWSLRALLERLRGAGVRPTVASLDPAQTADSHGVAAVSLGDPDDVERALRDSALAVWVGGEAEDTPPTAVAVCADLLAGRAQPDLVVGHLAMLCDVPLAAVGLRVGLSPLGLRAQPLWRRLLQGLAFAGVRDAPSREAVEAASADPQRPVYQADLRFLDVAAPSAGAAVTDGARLVVVWREGVTTTEAVAHACRSWLEANGPAASVVLATTAATAAAKASLEDIGGRIAQSAQVRLEDPLATPDRLWACLAGADVALAADSSSYIAAWRARAALVAVAPDNECADLLTRAGYNMVLTPGEAQPDVLARAVVAARETGAASPPRPELLTEEAARAEACVRHLLQMLDGVNPPLDAALQSVTPSARTLWRAAPVDDTGRLLRDLRAAEARAMRSEVEMGKLAQSAEAAAKYAESLREYADAKEQAVAAAEAHARNLEQQVRALDARVGELNAEIRELELSPLLRLKRGAQRLAGALRRRGGRR